MNFNKLKAKWIWANNCNNEINEYVDFFKSFTIDETKPAILYISADTEYAVFLNDDFIGSGQWSNFPENKTYDTFKVSLKKGANTLSINAYYEGQTSSHYFKGEKGLIFALDLGNEFIVSDKNVLARLNGNYRNGAIQRTSPQAGFTFIYDANNCNGSYDSAIEKNINQVIK
jgi:hypothetical protein